MKFPSGAQSELTCLCRDKQALKGGDDFNDLNRIKDSFENKGDADQHGSQVTYSTFCSSSGQNECDLGEVHVARNAVNGCLWKLKRLWDNCRIEGARSGARKHSPNDIRYSSYLLLQRWFSTTVCGFKTPTLLAAATFVLLATAFSNNRSASTASSSRNLEKLKPEWHWDRNAYHRNESSRLSLDFGGTEGNRERTLLLLVRESAKNSGSTLSYDLQNAVTEISSRPNRAYARAWGRDYAAYSGQASTATLLQHVHEKHNIIYDTILIIPSDAIVTNLDYDLLGLLPGDKLAAAVYNGNDDEEVEGVFFFNFRHPYAAPILRTWTGFSMNSTDPKSRFSFSSFRKSVETIRDNFAPNATSSNPSQWSTEFNDKSILNWLEAPNGAIETTRSDQVPAIKLNSLLNTRNGRRQRPAGEETVRSLESTADSVCFRYFPKCDLF